LHDVKAGFYVDVGANDPTIDSVTKFFYERGWHGINLEPIPSVYKRIEESRPRDINLNMGASDTPGELTLREYSDGWHGWSTLSPATKKAHANKKHQDYTVQVATLRDIFAEHKVKQIDFLKVDVEGFEYEVLSGNDWKKYRPKVVVVEGKKQKWIKFLTDVDYTVTFFDGLNTYFVRNDLTKTHTMDDYTSVLLAGQTVLTNREYSLNEQYKVANRIADTLNKDLTNLKKRYDSLDSRWREIQQNPEKFIGIRRLAAGLARRLLMKGSRHS